MQESLEMVTASRMQNMVEIRKKNTCFLTILFFRICWKSSFGALGVESPYGGDMEVEDAVTVEDGWESMAAAIAMPITWSMEHHGPMVAPKNDSPNGSQKE